MKPLILRSIRDLALVPLTAVIVYALVMHLPYKVDADPKLYLDAAGRALANQARTEALGSGSVLDAWKPWYRLVQGESVGLQLPFTRTDFARALWQSAQLGTAALGWAALGGGLFAFLRAWNRHRWVTRALEPIPAIVFGSPIFVLGIIVALVVPTGALFTRAELLASITMAIAPAAFIGVILSDALTAERTRPYIVTAVAKGCSPSRAILRHALPNALPALLDAVAPVVVSLVTGSFVAEKFFNVEGFGYRYVMAAQNPDPGTVVVATTLFASIFVVVSIAVGVLRYLLDPQARLAARRGTD